MKILVVDDERPARQRLIKLINDMKSPRYQAVGDAANGQDAVDMCHKQPIDLVLMDIRMPGLDGIAAARQLGKLKIPPAVIFTTAFEQHALEAFEANAVGYLLKPIRKEKLIKAIEGATRLNMTQLDALGDSQGDFMTVQVHGNLKRIMLKDVIYFHADQKYVNIVHVDGEALTEESLKSIGLKYSDKFMRIHRNALVSKTQLIGLSKTPLGQHYAELTGVSKKLEVSRRHLAEVKKWLKG